MRLAEAMSANFALRRRVYGEAALGEANLKMIAVAEEAGLPVKFPGSGGAVVGMATTEEVGTYSCLLLPTLPMIATLPTVPPAVPTEPHLPRPPPRRRGE